MGALSITAANVLDASNARKRSGVAGATITAGMPVYRDVDGVYQKSRANGATAAACDGISLNGASTGQPFDIQTDGDINVGAALTVGEIYCVSDATAGLIVPHGDLGSADFTTVLGIATATDNLQMQIHAGGVAKA